MTSATAFIDVSGRIRDDILGGALRPGERLKLDQLARRYATGHTPVREALRQLQGERLVEMVPNCGARVRHMDVADVSDMFDVRMALEALLARQAAQRMDETQLRALETVHRSLERNLRHREYAAVVTDNRDFHRLLGEAAGNREAMDILERHWKVIPTLWKTIGYAHERFPQVVDDHAQILSAIESRDADAAACLAMAHVVKAKRHLLSRLGTTIRVPDHD